MPRADTEMAVIYSFHQTGMLKMQNCVKAPSLSVLALTLKEAAWRTSDFLVVLSHFRATHDEGLSDCDSSPDTPVDTLD